MSTVTNKCVTKQVYDEFCSILRTTVVGQIVTSKELYDRVIPRHPNWGVQRTVAGSSDKQNRPIDSNGSTALTPFANAGFLTRLKAGEFEVTQELLQMLGQGLQDSFYDIWKKLSVKNGEKVKNADRYYEKEFQIWCNENGISHAQLGSNRGLLLKRNFKEKKKGDVKVEKKLVKVEAVSKPRTVRDIVIEKIERLIDEGKYKKARKLRDLMDLD